MWSLKSAVFNRVAFKRVPGQIGSWYKDAMYRGAVFDTTTVSLVRLVMKW